MSEVVELQDKKKPTQLPEPKGYRLLIGIPEVEEKTVGGIIKTDQARDTEAVASVVGFVLAVGPDAYKDEKLGQGLVVKDSNLVHLKELVKLQ